MYYQLSISLALSSEVFPTMWKKKLLVPPSKFLRRSTLSTSQVPVRIVSPPPCYGVSMTFRGETSGDSLSGGYDSVWDLPFAARCYCCSKISENVESAAKCWNCGAAAQRTPFLACNSCRTVQPVDESVDYFQIFGLEKNYEIECSSLEGKYKEWQKKLHPDLVHMKSEQEKEYAAEQSSRVIDAYRTLSKPLTRAIYVLKLEGVDVDEEETVSEPELLMEILEIREAVEEASTSQALNQIHSEMEDKLKHWSDAFAKAIHTQKFEDAITCIRRMKYYTKVNEEITKKL